MHAWLCENPIGAEALTWKELPTPEPKAGEVRVAIRAASLNFPDLLIVQNKYQMKPPLPFVPGSEYAGVVEAVGDGVTGLKPGDAVAAFGGTGGFAHARLRRGGAGDAAAAGLRVRRRRRLHPHLRHHAPRAARPRRVEGRRDAARARRGRRRRHGGDPDRQGRRRARHRGGVERREARAVPADRRRRDDQLRERQPARRAEGADRTARVRTSSTTRSAAISPSRCSARSPGAAATWWSASRKAASRRCR